MVYTYTRSADTRARGKTPHYLTLWQVAQSDITDLLQWAYVDGRAFAPGIFDLQADLHPGEHTHRNSRLWCGAEFIVLDVDEAAGLTWDTVKDSPYIRSHAAAIFPSSSYTPNTLKLHIIIPLAERITDRRAYRATGDHIARQLGFPVDTSTLNPAQAIYGTVFNQPEMHGITPALDDGLCWINTNVTPVTPVSPEAPPQEYSGLTSRVKHHQAADSATQINVILEALNAVLTPAWGEQPREARLQTIMAAFHGSSDATVLWRFLEYSSPRWDVSSQRRTLTEWWAAHKPREGGITVATLFAQAREQGWLQQSSVELQGATQIHAAEVSDWLLQADLPPRVLLKSGTGTGKTQGAIALLKRMQGEQEVVRAVFFAPSIKLCHALSASLTHAGVTNTLYIEDGRKTKDRDTLRAATVLVTTLQTFAIKAFSGGQPLIYDLMVMDECDELLSAFVRSGISRKIAQSSHVDGIQARAGVDALVHLFKTTKQILLLDGTMTELSRYLTYQWTAGIGVYENTYRREKAPVMMYPNLQSIRDDIVDHARAGQQIVIACDTKAEAALIEQLLLITEAAAPDELLRITGDTAVDPRVNKFFRDVEAGAQEYRILIYNSAMGSGVSILNTRPDMLYLISTYLPPRRLLQMLNRYRRQTAVRAYVQPRESLYHASANERYRALLQAATSEERLLGIDRATRSSTAQIVSDAALIAATDDYEQHRSVYDFFLNLLHEDGRVVYHHYETTANYAAVLQQVKVVIKEQKDAVRRGWRAVAPLKRGDSFPDGIDAQDAAKALLHGYIDDLFPGHTETELPDDEVARLALTYGKYKGVIRRWLNPDSAVQTALKELKDTRKESVTYRLYLARIELVTQVHRLFGTLDMSIDDDDLEARAFVFLDAVQQREAVYNLIAPTDAPYAALVGSPVQRAIKAARTVLKSVGIGLKRSNGKRTKDGKRSRRTVLRNVDDLLQVARLCKLEHTERLNDFGYVLYQGYQEQLKTIIPRFKRLPGLHQQRVMDTLEAIDTTFEHVVQLQDEQIFQ